MGIIDKFGKKMGIGRNSDEYDDLFDEGYEDEEEEEGNIAEEKARTNLPPRKGLGSSNVVDFTSTIQSIREQSANQAKESATPTEKQAPQQNMKVIVIEPTSFDDSQQISKCIMDRRPVVINFENTDTAVAHRIIDFISGTVYALDGDIRKISRNVFLCAPQNVNVSYSDDARGSFAADLNWMKNNNK